MRRLAFVAVLLLSACQHVGGQLHGPEIAQAEPPDPTPHCPITAEQRKLALSPPREVKIPEDQVWNGRQLLALQAMVWCADDALQRHQDPDKQ
jgi:hypothetical protein